MQLPAMLFRAIVPWVAVGGLVGLALSSPVSDPHRAAPGEDWRITEGITYENLTVFPVVSADSQDTSAFMTLDEGLASGDVLITERGNETMRRTRNSNGAANPLRIPDYETAEVNRLVLINRGSKPLLLLAGEIISGGKQDRIISKDRIVPVGAEPLPLDVFCVEHGRWASASSKFAAGYMMVHPSVREKAVVDQDQGQVWAAVQSGTTAHSSMPAAVPAAAAPVISARLVDEIASTSAPTQSYRKIYQESRVGTSVEDFAGEVQRRFDQAVNGLKGQHVIGVVVAYGGEVAWSDLFASSQLFRRYWPKLLRSYAVEALARPQLRERATLEQAREFLARSGKHERSESEPGVYRWSERSDGRYAEIVLEALDPKPMVLHRLQVLRTS